MTIITQVSGSAVPVPGADIDTDRIIPARFLKEISFDNMGNYLFYDVRFNADQSPKEHPLNDTKYLDASIMIVGRNFGCGSSREHAPQAIHRYGINAIIGESFAEIFAGNCKAIGMPLVTADKETLDTLSELVSKNPKLELKIDIQAKTVTCDGKIYQVDMSSSHRESFLKGYWNVLSLLKENSEKTKALSENLYY